MNFVGFDLLRKMPPITLNLFALSFLLSLMVLFGIVQPNFLVLQTRYIIKYFEVHRLLTGFLFFGPLSLNYLIFCVYNLSVIAKFERAYAGNTKKCIALLLFVYLSVLAMSLATPIPYACMPFFTALQFVYCLQHPYELYYLYGLFVIQSRWMPLVHMGIALASGQGLRNEIIGASIGGAWVLAERYLPLFDRFDK